MPTYTQQVLRGLVGEQVALSPSRELLEQFLNRQGLSLSDETVNDTLSALAESLLAWAHVSSDAHYRPCMERMAADIAFIAADGYTRAEIHRPSRGAQPPTRIPAPPVPYP